MQLFFTRITVIRFCIIALLFANIPAICYSQFLGGNADGHADINLINTVCSVTSVNPFAGGNADGHADINLINTVCSVTSVNPFAGGNADGYADINLINTICSVTSVNPFAGGNADGHADINLINTICSVTSVNPFAGGNADGHADINLINTICSVTSVNPFAGGNADGHADINLINTVCSVTSVNPFAGGNADGHADIQRLVIDPLDCTTPLPIELLYFDAKCKNGKVNITWASASEINNDYFTIDRSKDAINFQIIGKINGAGNSSQTINYSFIDSDPLTGIFYYRLKQTDFDGKFKYFNLVAVDCNNNISDINIYPNPNNGHFIIDGVEPNSQLIIFNSLGEKIINQNISSTKTEIDLSGLASGIYFIHIGFEKGAVSRKISINQ